MNLKVLILLQLVECFIWEQF